MSRASRRSAVLLTFARRGEEEAIREALAGLRHEMPEADVFAVGTSVSAPTLRTIGISAIVTYGDGRGLRAVVRDARSRRPAAALVVYWDTGAAGHLKLEALALLSGASITYRFVPGAGSKAVGRLRLACSVAVKCVASMAYVTAGAAMCAIALVCLRGTEIFSGGKRAHRD